MLDIKLGVRNLTTECRQSKRIWNIPTEGEGKQLGLVLNNLIKDVVKGIISFMICSVPTIRSAVSTIIE